MQKLYLLSKHLLIMLWIGVNLLLGALFVVEVLPARAFSSQSLQLATATPTSTPTIAAPSPDPYLQFYGTIAGALATILAAFIGGGFIIYQMRKNHRLERDKQQMQSRLEIALDHQQFLEDLGKMRYGERLATEREERERERQRRTAANDSVKTAMRRAKTPSERKKAYREALHADPDISRLQILEMSQPLEVTKVYVRLRLHEDPQLSYEPDSLLLAAEAQRDPNALIKAGRILLDTRSSEAMSPEDALRRYSRYIILGDPGAGKSTLLKYLTLKSIDGQLPNLPDLPIHITLGQFAYSDKPDLIAFVAARWNERYGFPEEEARVFIEENLTDGSAMLLLDALDETVIGESAEIADDSYRRVLTAINQVATRYHKAPLVVTARKAGYYRRTRLNGFTELEVLDFRPNEIKQFITNWFACRPTQRRYATADDLNVRLENNQRMQSLAANPLLLSLIVMVYEELQDLPEKRAELYKQCTDTLLFKWDTSRDIRRRSEFKPEHKRQLLAEIAWHFHQQGRRYFPEDELLSLIAKFLPTVSRSSEQNKLLLREIEEENGILKEQAHGWHGFLHLTLQEYFVAQYASENNKLDELLRFIGDTWWEEVLSLYAGYTSDAGPLLQKLLAQEKHQILWKDVFHTHLLWAGRCLIARPRVVQTSLREEVIAHLFDLHRKTPFPLTRDQVTSTLIEVGGNEVRTKALAVLKDKQENSNARVKAASILSHFEEKTIVTDLLAVIRDKQDASSVRRKIVSILGDLKEQTIMPDLQSVFEDKQDDARVREEIAPILSRLKSQAAKLDLLAALKDKQDNTHVRGRVALYLDTKEQAAMPDLLAVLKDKQDNTDVRGQAASALDAFKDRTVIPDLLAVLKDKQDNAHVRRRVAWTLVNLGESKAVPYLLRLISGSRFFSSDQRHTLESLIRDYATIRACAKLLRKVNLAEDIHRVLWVACQREKIHIAMIDWKVIRLVKVTKW